VVFVTALVAAIGLAFTIENLNPQIRPVTKSEEETGFVRRRSPRAS
jgi:hypothetical protein